MTAEGEPLTGSPITTGSGLERAMECRASNVLDRVWAESSTYAERGTAIHSYLQRISDGATPDESLALVDDDHRDACEGLDLDGLQLDQLSAEVTFVIHLVTGQARILGQGLERDYAGVGPDEVPLTIDLAGADLTARRGKVADHKSGWSRRTRASDNWQIKGAAYALGAVYDLDEVDGELITHRDGRPPRRDRAVFDAADLLVARADLRELHTRTVADRAARAAGKHIEPTEGSWCRYCPCAWSCPAKIGTLRLALAPSDDTYPITVADAGRALDMIAAGKKALSALETRIYAMAATAPGGRLLLRVSDDGTETWLGAHEREGNEQLRADIAIDAAAKVLGVPPEDMAAFQREVAELRVTKSKLEEVAKKRSAPRKGAESMRAILADVRAAGGAVKPIRHDVGVFTVRPMPAASEGP